MQCDAATHLLNSHTELQCTTLHCTALRCTVGHWSLHYYLLARPLFVCKGQEGQIGAGVGKNCTLHRLLKSNGMLEQSSEGKIIDRPGLAGTTVSDAGLIHK